jgi:hypothetical protein
VDGVAVEDGQEVCLGLAGTLVYLLGLVLRLPPRLAGVVLVTTVGTLHLRPDLLQSRGGGLPTRSFTRNASLSHNR